MVSKKEIYQEIPIPNALPLEISAHEYRKQKLAEMEKMAAKGYSFKQSFRIATGKHWGGKTPSKKGLKTSGGKTGKTLVTSAAVAVSIVSGLVLGSVTGNIPNPASVVASTSDESMDSVDSVTDEKNILVVGLDTRPEKNHGDGDNQDVPGNRTDAIMVVKYSPESENKISVVSIPRDVGVSTQACGIDASWEVQKINSIYDDQGTECLADVAGSMIGEHIDATVEVGFDSFIDVIDSLGGITITTKGPVIDDVLGTIIKSKGTHHIDGNTALQYSRARTVKGSSKSDFDRVKRQQQVAQAIVDAAAKSSNMTKLSAAKTMLTSVLPNVQVSGLSTLEMLGMMKMAPQLAQSKINAGTIPIVEEDDGYGNLIYDQHLTRGIFDTLGDTDQQEGTTADG